MRVCLQTEPQTGGHPSRAHRCCSWFQGFPKPTRELVLKSWSMIPSLLDAPSLSLKPTPLAAPCVLPPHPSLPSALSSQSSLVQFDVWFHGRSPTLGSPLRVWQPPNLLNTLKHGEAVSESSNPLCISAALQRNRVINASAVSKHTPRRVVAPPP